MKPFLLGAAVLATLVAGTSAARAEGPVVTADMSSPPPVTASNSERGSREKGPNVLMLGSGLAIFGASYAPAVIVGATSARDADKAMLVPVAGPWLALADRGDCGGSTGRSCDTETTYKVLIVVDGIFQAIGVADAIASVFEPEAERQLGKSDSRRSSHKPFEPHVSVAPTSVGSGYGFGAVGTF
ncbi:MAG TPA: hypothetical protein VF407_16720 [Polyangiaceae bacterium]